MDWITSTMHTAIGRCGAVSFVVFKGVAVGTELGSSSLFIT